MLQNGKSQCLGLNLNRGYKLRDLIIATSHYREALRNTSPSELTIINSSIPQNKIKKAKQILNTIKLRYIKILLSHKIHLRNHDVSNAIILYRDMTKSYWTFLFICVLALAWQARAQESIQTQTACIYETLQISFFCFHVISVIKYPH